MEYIFVLSLFIVAFLYSSLGHGGASGYLAIMSLFGLALVFMRSTALFIFLNSLAGLFALVQGGLNLEPRLIVWIGADVLGGISGSYLGISRIKPVRLKYVLSAILLVASIKLFLL